MEPMDPFIMAGKILLALIIGFPIFVVIFFSVVFIQLDEIEKEKAKRRKEEEAERGKQKAEKKRQREIARIAREKTPEGIIEKKIEKIVETLLDDATEDGSDTEEALIRKIESLGGLSSRRWMDIRDQAVGSDASIFVDRAQIEVDKALRRELIDRK